MAEYIPNQPVYFGVTDNCTTDEIDYKQLVDNSDTTQFQLLIDRCEDSEDVVLNGDFNTNLSSWTFEGAWYQSNGKMCIDATGDPTEFAYTSQTGRIIRDHYYCVEIEVYGISGGGLRVQLGDTVVGIIYSPGSYKFYGYHRKAAAIIADIFSLTPLSGLVSVCIEKVAIFEIAREFIVVVRSIKDEYIGEFSFDQNPDLFVFAKNTVTITIPWQEINAENGCYYLCVMDPCVNTNGQNYPAKIINCSFLSETDGWGYPGYTWVSTGFIITSISTVGPVNTASQSNVFESFSVDYHVTIDVVITGSGKLDVYFGTELIETIEETGVFNVVGMATGTHDLSLKSYITGAPGTIQINSACPTSVIYGNADIENCEFDDGDGNWEGNWQTFASGSERGLFAELSSGAPVKSLIQADVFGNTSKEYGLHIRVGIPPGEDITFKVYFGTNLIKTIINTGTYDIYGYPAGNSDLKIEATLNSGSTGLPSIFFACPILRDSEFECNFSSNYFRLGDYSNACTILVNACNNDDAMGFVFDGSDFSPRLRINAKLKQAKYPASEKSMYDDSEGTRRTVNFRARKAKNFCTEWEPEYIHDFLSTLRGYDNVYFDSVLYVCDDTEYNVEYGDMDNFGKVKVLFSEKTQGVIKNNCTDNENDCRIAEAFLLQADDPTSFITQTDGGLINING